MGRVQAAAASRPVFSAFERCISLFRAAGVAEVIAVLGHRADELRPLTERAGARCVMNTQFDQGMYLLNCCRQSSAAHWVKGSLRAARRHPSCSRNHDSATGGGL